MRANSKIVIEITTGEVLHRDSFEYSGPVAQAISGSGSKSKQSSQQSSQQTSESGTKYNEEFLNKALALASRPAGKQKLEGAFNAEKYLADNPGLYAQGYPLQPQFAEKHYLETGKAAGLKGEYTEGPEVDIPGYDPTFVRSGYTPGEFTAAGYTPGAYTAGKFTGVAPEGFNRLESNLYEGQASKLSRGYSDTVARQREELAQSGALNSPAQFLEGSARSGLDRNYMEGLQQAARDAFLGRIGLEEREAGRRTGFDVGEAGARTAYDVGEGRARTAYDVGEAGRRTGYDVTEAERQTGFGERGAERETAFNQDVQTKLLEYFLKKLGITIEAGRYSTGQGSSQGSSSGTSMGGSGGIFSFGGSSSSSGYNSGGQE